VIFHEIPEMEYPTILATPAAGYAGTQVALALNESLVAFIVIYHVPFVSPARTAVVKGTAFFAHSYRASTLPPLPTSFATDDNDDEVSLAQRTSRVIQCGQGTPALTCQLTR
jgi:hypothetical protein